MERPGPAFALPAGRRRPCLSHRGRIVVGLYALASHRGPQTNQRPTPESAPTTAEDILKARYARGEIDRETYLQMLRDLQTPPSRPQPPSA